MCGTTGITLVYLARYPDFSRSWKAELRRQDADDRHDAICDGELRGREVRRASEELFPVAIPDQRNRTGAEALILRTKAAAPYGLDAQDRKEITRNRGGFG